MSLVVIDTTLSGGSTTNVDRSIHGDLEYLDEPGSPIFHDALMFSSQVQLNDLYRDRRGVYLSKKSETSNDTDQYIE